MAITQRSITSTRAPTTPSRRRRYMPIIADNHGTEVLGDVLHRAGYLIDSSSLPGGFRGKNVWALLTREGRPAMAIVYPPGKGDVAFRNMQKLWQSSFGQRRSSSGLPEPLEYLPEIDALITQRCDGPSLADPSRLTDENIVEAIHLLASLHDCDAQPETRRNSRAILRSMQRRAEHIFQHVPQHRDCVARLVEAMEAARTRDSELVPSQ